jgi:hypothetical protein
LVLGLIEGQDAISASVEEERSPRLGWLSLRGGLAGTFQDELPQAIACGRYGPELRTVLNYRGWPATIVSNQGDAEIRRFLRARGYRTKAAGWRPEIFEGFAQLSRRVSFYTVRGDAGLVARRDIGPRITFGDLAQVLAGMISLKELLHRAKPKDQGVPGVPSKAVVIDQGREVL